MNKKIFFVTTAFVALVLVGLFCVRIGLDEVAHTSALLRAVDTMCGLALCILGFVASLSFFILGGDPPSHGMLVFVLGIIISSVIWGILVERALHFIRKGTVAT